MKNVVKLLSVIILASIITFTMASCGDGPGGGNGGGGGAGAGSAFTIYDEGGNKYTLAFSGSGRSARAAGNDNSQGNNNSQGKRGDNYTITVTGSGGNTIGTNNGKIGNVDGGSIYELTQDGGESLNVETTKEGRILRFPKVISLGNGKLHEVNGYLSHNGQKVEIREVTVPGSSLADKLAWLKANAQSNTRYTVAVDKNETLNGTGSYSLNDINYLEYPRRSNVTVLLKSSQTISLSSNGCLFSVGSGVTLELENVILQGKSNNDYYSSVVYVNSGMFTIQGSSKITGNERYGVNVVCGIFIMKDNAEVYGNSIGVNIENGIFTMQNNAKVHDNIENGTPDAGVSIINGIFTMKGNAEIHDNLGCGLYIEGSKSFSIMQDNTKIYNNGSLYGGIYLRGPFIMNGGEIYGNTIEMGGYPGGGVYVDLGGIFHITNGIIYGSNEVNTALRNIGRCAFPERGDALYKDFSYIQVQYGNGNVWTDLPLTEGIAYSTPSITYIITQTIL